MAKAKTTTAKKALTKSQILQALADKTELTKKQVGDFFDALADLVKDQLGKRGPEAFTIPSVGVKLTVQHKPAQKAKKGVPNPFKPGETMDVAAKPASKKVKARALKALNDMI